MRRSKLTRDALLSLAGIGMVGGSAAVYSVFVGRVLGATALGHAGVALAIGLGAAQLAMAGVAPAVTRFTAAHRAAGRMDAARRLWADGLVAALGIGTALGLGIALTGPRWAAFVGLPPGLIVPVAWLAALQCIYIGLKAVLYGIGATRAYAIAETVAGIAFGIALIGVLAGAPMSLIAPFLVANAVFFGAGAWLVASGTRPLPQNWGRGQAREALPGVGGELHPPTDAPPPPTAGGGGRGEGAGRPPVLAPPTSNIPRFILIATLGSAAALARLQLPALITSAWWPAGEVGRLAAAMSFLPPVLLLPRALELALLPALAGAWGRGDRAAFRAATVHTLRSSALALTAIVGVLLVIGPTLLVWLYGPEFAPAAPALRAVLVSAWALGIAMPAVVALSASDGVAIPNAAGVAGLVVSLVAWAAWVPDYGATGAALGLAAGSLVNAGVPLVAAARRLGLGWRA